MSFFPPRLWGLDRLYWTHVKLNCKDILELPEYPSYNGCYCVGNHPVVRAEVMGDIVKLHRKTKNVVFDLDDGTGICSCCLWLRDEEDFEDLMLGQLVTVRGKITTYRGVRQLTTSSVYIERDVHAECRRWMELIHLKATVYRKPFIPPKDATEESRQQPSDLASSDPLSAAKQSISNFVARRGVQMFTFKEVKEEPVVISTLVEILHLKPDALHDDRQLDKIHHLLGSALRHMTEEGKVCLIDIDEDRYEVLDHRSLAPQVLHIIAGLQAQGGVHLEAIVTSLHTNRKFVNVQRSLIKDAVAQLLSDSDIYEVSYRRYKTTD
eukprot:m.23406 g.23406  ORF g.23406 m.23406 type:complete len:323 (+) comp28464_c0_seq2:34-1002(+)